MSFYEMAHNIGKGGFIKDDGSLRSTLTMGIFCANRLGDYEKALHFALLHEKAYPSDCIGHLELSISYFNLKT